MKKLDLVLAAFFILMASVILFFNLQLKTEGETAVVTKDGEILTELDLSEDTIYEIEINDQYNRVKVEDGYVSMDHANCRDQLCVHYAPISDGPSSIVCLPHRVVISINLEKQGELDAISQ